jgi:hypothetical protein
MSIEGLPAAVHVRGHVLPRRDRVMANGWIQAVVLTAQIVDLLEDHILREESDLFPAAYQLLGSDAWATIAASTSTAESRDAPAAPQAGDPRDQDQPEYSPVRDVGQRVHTQCHTRTRGSGGVSFGRCQRVGSVVTNRAPPLGLSSIVMVPL